MLSDKRDRALIALVAVDALLKACARLFLRGEPPLSLVGRAIGLGYVENDSGFGYDQSRLLGLAGVATDDAFVVCSLLVFLLLALAIHLWHKVELKPWIKTLAVLALYAVAASAALALAEYLQLSLGRGLRSAARAAGPLAVAIVLYAETRAPYYRFCSLLLLAGNIGNCASLLAPPHLVIDYFGMYRPEADVYVYANAADAYLVAATALIALIPVGLAARALSSLYKSRNASEV
jgi:hypothetical protein